MMVKKFKEKKRLTTPVKLNPQPGWNLGRHVTITIASGKPVPAFLNTMIVKHTDKGGPR